MNQQPYLVDGDTYKLEWEHPGQLVARLYDGAKPSTILIEFDRDGNPPAWMGDEVRKAGLAAVAEDDLKYF